MPRPGYPFRLAAALDYELTADRLTITLRVRNDGDRRAPFGAGIHPYFAVGATRGRRHRRGRGDPARPDRAARVDGGLPTGARRRPTAPSAGSATAPSTPRSPTWSATTTAGRAPGCAARRASWSSPSTARGRGCRSSAATPLPEGQRRRSLAIEPMTCPPNALRRRRRPLVLEPGETWAGTWTLSWTRRPDVRVLELWRYPVKSLQGERLTEAAIGAARASPATAAGRCSTGTPGWGSPPGGCRSCCSARPGCAPTAGWRSCCPTARSPPTTRVLSDWLGRRVELRAATENAGERPPTRTRGRGAGRAGRVAAVAGRDRPVPRQPAHPAVAGLHRHARHLGPAPVPRQRRPGRRGRGRAARPGGRPGRGARCGFGVPIARCVMTTRPQPGGIARDTSVLKTIHRERDGLLAVRAAVAGARHGPRRRRAGPAGRQTERHAHRRPPPGRGHHPARASCSSSSTPSRPAPR